MTDKEIEKTLKVKSQGLYYKNRDRKSVNLDEYDEKQFLGSVLDYINRLKANLESAITSFTKMETLYKVKCKELEGVEDKIRKGTAKEIYDFARDFFEWDEEGFCRELADLLKQKYGVELDNE